MRWKLSTVATLAVALGACAPDIQEDPTPDVVVARFDPAATPAVVPSPTDLARDPATGRLNIPLPANPTPADEAFVAYLNALDGYPAGTSGAATFAGELDPATVNAGSVIVMDLTAQAPVPAEVGVSVADGEPPISTVHVSGPGGGWESGHQYMVAIIGGADGVRGTNNREVVGSPIWAFVRSENALVTCEDLTAADCRRRTTLLPDDASAVRLEQLRRSYAPLFAMLGSQGVERESVVQMWTFTIASGASPIFDPGASPPRVPTPTDLAIDPATGLVNAPVDPSASPAQQEFVRDYLNTLDGFPVSATAQVGFAGGGLDPATVTPFNVRVVDVTDLMGGGSGMVGTTLDYEPASRQLTIAPSTGGWTKGHTYAVALFAGEGGLTNEAGLPLQAPTAWALARSPAPLVTCEDLTAADCALAISAAPVTLEQALGLERLRRGFAPLMANLAAAGVAPEDVALMWSFSIVSQPELTFDPANAIIPFPNDLLLDRTDPDAPRVNLPIDDPASLEGQIIAGLNTLDGFGLTTTIISENSDELAATDVGSIDPGTLAGGAGFVSLMGATLTPQVEVCISCDSSAAPGEQPDQLQFVPVLPLEERSTYAGYVTTATRSTEGKAVVANPIFALVRSSAPLVDEEGNSTVDALTDAQAQALEPLRLGFKPVIDGLAAAGVARRDLSLAFPYTTQTGYSFLQVLNALPATAGLPTDVMGMTENPALSGEVGGGVTVYEGALVTANLLEGFSGPFNPAGPAPEVIRFVLAVPSGTAPAGGWPVTIFSHGLRGGRYLALNIAGALAGAGHATLAIDLTHHGDRSDCVGAGSLVAPGAPDSAVCNLVAGATCNPDTRRCETPDGTPSYMTGADGRTALISGWNIIETTNLFATRDRFRQAVIDFSQLTRVIQAGAFNDGTVALSTSDITYGGQSLGGILGTLFTAASPDVGNVALNVPGGGLVDVLLTAPAFSEQAEGFKALLASVDMPEGSPGYDNFINIARWIMDPADPLNAAHQVLNGPATPADRQALIHYIPDDQTIPNSTTEALIAAAMRGDRELTVRLFEAFGNLPPESRHGFLFHPETAAAAQAEISTFISTGSLP